MTAQSAVTIIAEIKPGEVEALRQSIRAMRDNSAGNDMIPFGKLDTVHFARLLVLDEDRDLNGALIPPQLIFMSDIDGPVDAFLDELVRIAARGVDSIYGRCESYPSPGQVTRQARLDYLRARSVKADAVYVNTTGRTVRQVHQEARLREAIEGFLDRSGYDRSDRSAREVRGAVRKFVHGEENLRWARKRAEQSTLPGRLKELAHMISVPLLLLILSPAIVVALPFLVVILRIHELTDPAPDVRPDPAHVQELADLEDRVVQNQFSAIGYAKPGPFRTFTATVVLWLVNYAARHFFNKGDLTGVTTIHFARWVFLNEKRRLVFASSYDGSLESYMDDFIDKVAWGLNAAFSNGVGYPKTNWLVADGATDEQAFKHYIRNHQFATDFWYSAYDNLTAVNIERNTKIRAGLYSPMNEKTAAAWLALL